MKIGVIIPALNGGQKLAELIADIDKQSFLPSQKLIIDSGSNDGTITKAKNYGWEILSIAKDSFNHGKTRGIGLQRLAANCDIAIFLTQDVKLFNRAAFAELIKPFSLAKVAAAYGRQLPFPKAALLAKQARLFNYPAEDSLKSLADKSKYGMKTAFFSDSFAAYRIEALQAVGGFPNKVIVAEDMYNAAKLLLAGYNIAYTANAKVYHSHDYKLMGEFRRYFDTGVFHSREAWLSKEFGKAEGEGIRLVKNQIVYLWQAKAYCQIPLAIAGDAVKLLAYRLGKWESKLPIAVKKRLSGQPYYFKK